MCGRCKARPLERQRVAEQGGVHNPRKSPILDGEGNSLDLPLDSVCQDAPSVAAVEGVGEPGAVRPVLDEVLPGGRTILRKWIARWACRVPVDGDSPIDRIGPRRHEGLAWYGGPHSHHEDEISTLLRDLTLGDVLVFSPCFAHPI